mmetsp:Transcript_23149/g.68222  ORF Transcript_23149/g.68222 Transcript_23149/m.68222 type:complete len:230 (-) Transcript_23149:850-1539(-)
MLPWWPRAQRPPLSAACARRRRAAAATKARRVASCTPTAARSTALACSCWGPGPRARACSVTGRWRGPARCSAGCPLRPDRTSQARSWGPLPKSSQWSCPRCGTWARPTTPRAQRASRGSPAIPWPAPTWPTASGASRRHHGTRAAGPAAARRHRRTGVRAVGSSRHAPSLMTAVSPPAPRAQRRARPRTRPRRRARRAAASGPVRPCPGRSSEPACERGALQPTVMAT